MTQAHLVMLRFILPGYLQFYLAESPGKKKAGEIIFFSFLYKQYASQQQQSVQIETRPAMSSQIMNHSYTTLFYSLYTHCIQLQEALNFCTIIICFDSAKPMRAHRLTVLLCAVVDKDLCHQVTRSLISMLFLSFCHSNCARKTKNLLCQLSLVGICPVWRNMSATHLNTIFRVFPNADGSFIFRWTQQVQYVFIVDLQSKGKSLTE